jgi:hypothetical protein
MQKNNIPITQIMNMIRYVTGVGGGAVYDKPLS